MMWGTVEQMRDHYQNTPGLSGRAPVDVLDCLNEIDRLTAEVERLGEFERYARWTGRRRVRVIIAAREVARLCHPSSNEIDFDYVSTKATEALAKLAEACDEPSRADGDVA